MLNCKICLGKIQHIHTPKKSKINLKIFICSNCGFVQSQKEQKQIKDKNKENKNTINFLSSDSDYSETRVGKQQMLPNTIKVLERNKNYMVSNPKILDMSSARGHFLEYISQYSNNDIVGFEQDNYMSESYRQTKKYKILNIDYRDYKEKETFDLIYSCHTLEHYSDPIMYLSFVSNHLNSDGLFLVDVPNLDKVNNGLVLDDFFYDKHRTYFEKRILRYLFSLFCLDIVDMFESNSSLIVLARKSKEKNSIGIPEENYTINKSNIDKYLQTLSQNRNQSPHVIHKINKEIKKYSDSPIIFYGAGRLLDGLIKYGDLKVQQIDYLVDNYLFTATKKVHGLDLYNEKVLKNIKNGLIFICAKSSSQEIYESLIRNYKFKKIIKIVDYFN
tara:strand:- start:3509 stop:4672 length:1164 start_codon:yes stop_codon:yes gene_type:complete